VGHGERVAIWAPNVWEWIVAALGAHVVGAAIVPLNTRFRGEEAADVLSRSGARVLVAIGPFLQTDYVAMLRESGADLPALRSIVVLRGKASGGVGTVEAIDWNTFLSRGETASDADLDVRATRVRPDDLSDVIFTSGTTGKPKGVMCTHAQTLRAFGVWSAIVGLRAGDRYLVVPPFFHTFGYKAGWLACLMTGATIHPQCVFDVAEVLARVAREKITVLPGPPALYQSILGRPVGQQDLSSLRLAVTGAAVIPVELVKRMRSELGFETVITAYGLTEGTGVATMCRATDDAETIATTSGRAIAGVEVRIVDDAGKEVPRGEAGEIVIRGYTVMRGYLDDPAATAEAIDREGFLRTGDIGTMDARGYIKITDRKKDMFIVGGFNVYPAEVEQVLMRHPAVGQVAVVGVRDERLGEVGKAFVVAKPGVTLVEEELIAWARERIANFKVPRRVEVIAALPTNASGKVVKARLRERG
jgi:HIP---CoA ligase